MTITKTKWNDNDGNNYDRHRLISLNNLLYFSRAQKRKTGENYSIIPNQLQGVFNNLLCAVMCRFWLNFHKPIISSHHKYKISKINTKTNKTNNNKFTYIFTYRTYMPNTQYIYTYIYIYIYIYIYNKNNNNQNIVICLSL